MESVIEFSKCPFPKPRVKTFCDFLSLGFRIELTEDKFPLGLKLSASVM